MQNIKSTTESSVVIFSYDKLYYFILLDTRDTSFMWYTEILNSIKINLIHQILVFHMLLFSSSSRSAYPFLKDESCHSWSGVTGQRLCHSAQCVSRYSSDWLVHIQNLVRIVFGQRDHNGFMWAIVQIHRTPNFKASDFWKILWPITVIFHDTAGKV